MKNKKYLVLGAGSFLGSSFLNSMKQLNYEIYGISNYQNDKFIVKSNYSLDSLNQILHDIDPDVIYDFKLSKVSSNLNDFNDSFEIMFKSNQNIINSLKKFNKKIDLHLISTSKLNNNLESPHPYLMLKKSQEFLYKKEFSESTNLYIHRVENVIGKGDLNFSRILPFFFGSSLVNKEVKFSSLSSFKRNYLTIEQFNHNLKEFNYITKKNINFNSMPLTNELLISKAKFYLEQITKEKILVYWENGSDSFEKYKNTNNSNREFLGIEGIAEWYVANKKYITEKFNKFQGSFN